MTHKLWKSICALVNLVNARTGWFQQTTIGM